MILLWPYPDCLLIWTLGWWIFEPLEVLARVLEVFEHLSDRVLIMLVFVLILVVLVLLWLNGLFHGLSSFARWVALMWSDGLVMH